jgi:glucose-1-phosphate thymidylyltransferase
VLVGIVPAAGHATRLGLLDGSKEMLPIRGRPVMDHLVERLRAAGIDELRVVTRPEKLDVIAHAEAIGARVVTGYPVDVAASLTLGLHGLHDADEVLFGFPDTVWEPLDGYVPVLAALRAGAEVALGLFATPDLGRSDIIVFGPDGTIAGIDVKPRILRGDRIWGIAAVHARTLRGLREGTEPGVYFGELARDGGVVGVHLSSEWLDIGIPEALSRAQQW